MDVGTRIKKFRERQNISQDELALKIFVSRQTISNWETNKSYPDGLMYGWFHCHIQR